MKVLRVLAGVALLVFLTSSLASAATTTGTTTLLGTPTSGSSVSVDVSIVSTTPVVPYEYAIQNECFFSGRLSGNPDSYQRDDIVNWDSSVGTVPHTIMPVYLKIVPTGSVCKVFLVKNNTVVK